MPTRPVPYQCSSQGHLVCHIATEGAVRQSDDAILDQPPAFVEELACSDLLRQRCREEDEKQRSDLHNMRLIGRHLHVPKHWQCAVCGALVACQHSNKYEKLAARWQQRWGNVQSFPSSWQKQWPIMGCKANLPNPLRQRYPGYAKGLTISAWAHTALSNKCSALP